MFGLSTILAISASGSSAMNRASGSSTSGGSSSSDASGKPPDQPDLCGGSTGMIMMLLMFFILYMMLNPDLRTSIAIALDGVFSPIFGFDYKYPILTMLAASIFMVFCSTTIRHLMTDWVGIARAQKFMNSYQKEKMDAMTSGNTVKLKKLEELTPEISKNNMTLMVSNLKPMAFTMIFFIIVFPWLWAVYFEELADLGNDFVSLPGIDKWTLSGSINICPGGFNTWILIYIVLSFPVSFLLQNALKYISFTQRIKKTEVKEEKKIQTELQNLEVNIEKLDSRGIQTQKARELLSQSSSNIENKHYGRAMEIITEANEHLENKTRTYERIIGLINQAESMILNAEKKEIRVSEAEKSLENARKALNRNDDTQAIYYAKQSQRQIKESREKHREAEETLSNIKALMYDVRELDTKEVDRTFEKALDAMKEKEYANVITYSKEAKIKAEEISKLNDDAKASIEKLEKLLQNIKHLNLEIADAADLYQQAMDELKHHRYERAQELAEQCNELITQERDNFQNAQESVSFAKLVISNAISFGASIPDAERYAADAESALNIKNYRRAIELANKAKDIAETAKRQQQRLAKRK
jgi:uncharacterized membrane protein (DUF106 family)